MTTENIEPKKAKKLEIVAFSTVGIALISGLAWAYHKYISLPYINTEIPADSVIFQEDHFLIASGDSPNTRKIQLNREYYMKSVKEECERLLNSNPNTSAVADCTSTFNILDGSLLGTAETPQVEFSIDQTGNIPLNYFGTVTITQEELLQFLQKSEYTNRFTTEDFQDLLAKVGYGLIAGLGSIGIGKLGIMSWRKRQKSIQDKINRRLKREAESISLVRKNRVPSTRLPANPDLNQIEDRSSDTANNLQPSLRAQYLIDQMKAQSLTREQKLEDILENRILRDAFLYLLRRDNRYRHIDKSLSQELLAQLIKTADLMKLGKIGYHDLSEESDTFPKKHIDPQNPMNLPKNN